MVVGIDIDLDKMALGQQVLVRQAGHSRAIGSHVQTYATLDKADFGLILQMFSPINDALVKISDQAFALSGRAFDEGASRMGKSRDLYLDAERAAAERNSSVARQLGMSPAPYAAPGIPTLGAALDDAGTRYGVPDGNVFEQAFWDGYKGAEWATETYDQVTGRPGIAFQQNRNVEEAVDVRSFLPVPQANEPELENIRWKAGVIFGGVDWLFEELFGYSLLEEITKPFAGNWTRMNEGAVAWTHSSDALVALSRNSAALTPSMADWTGRGSENFVVAAAAMSQAHQLLSGPAGTVSMMLKGLAALAKEMAGFVLKQLKRLQARLIVLATEAAIPVVGWVAAAITAGISLVETAQMVMDIYKKINKIYDLITSMVSGVTQLSDSFMRMSDLLEGLARGAAARV